MQSRSTFLILIVFVALALAGVWLARFWPTEADTEDPDVGEAATVVAIPGTDRFEITLTAEAAQRLGITVAPAQAGVVAYAAILYDAQGQTWVYANPKPLTYIRQPVQVARIDGEHAVLTHGPPPGTAVVVQGAAELYGSESEFVEE